MRRKEHHLHESVGEGVDRFHCGKFRLVLFEQFLLLLCKFFPQLVKPMQDISGIWWMDTQGRTFDAPQAQN